MVAMMKTIFADDLAGWLGWVGSEFVVGSGGFRKSVD